MNEYKIPADFMIGTSSSAWQIEGNDGKDASQKSWADLFYETNPDLWHNHIGPQKASDFYHRYKEDIKTMASFGMNTFRFTIQWARFMKDPLLGIVDENAVAYYQDVIDTIKANGMKPVISLEHWDIPAILFEKYNGWVGRETVTLYQMYAKAVFEHFAKDVTYFFAFTEPNIPIDNGYMDALWYPFKHAPKEAYQAHFHKVLATSIAAKEIQPYKEKYGCKLGAMVHMTPIYARSDDEKDQKAAYYADLFQVRIYLDPYLKGTYPEDLLSLLKENDCMFTYETKDMEFIKKNRIDILGVDYYFPIRVKARENTYEGIFHPEKYYEKWVMPERKYNADRGWEIYEKAVYDTGMRIKNEYDNFDWFISENGIGIEGEDRYRNAEGRIDDDYRIEFLKEHLKWALKAKEDGCNCHGYLVWSYIDNVSARNSFKNRYGLLELNLDTYERIPKKSAYWFKEIMEKGRID